eukprot:8700995-Pyramimonas_sp.AAC.2
MSAAEPRETVYTRRTVGIRTNMGAYHLQAEDFAVVTYLRHDLVGAQHLSDRSETHTHTRAHIQRYPHCIPLSSTWTHSSKPYKDQPEFRVVVRGSWRTVTRDGCMYENEAYKYVDHIRCREGPGVCGVWLLMVVGEKVLNSREVTCRSEGAIKLTARRNDVCLS